MLLLLCLSCSVVIVCVMIAVSFNFTHLFSHFIQNTIFVMKMIFNVPNKPKQTLMKREVTTQQQQQQNKRFIPSSPSSNDKGISMNNIMNSVASSCGGCRGFVH